MSPEASAVPGGRVPGPLDGKGPEANANTNSPPFSCQVITRKVNIQVGDVNDNAPTFHNQPYSVRIPEVGVPGLQLRDIGRLLLQGHLGVAQSWGNGSPATLVLSRPMPAPGWGRSVTILAPLKLAPICWS